MPTPLMPKATAIWLLDNTALTFDQIADFCGLHILEIQSLADSEVYIVGIDPIASGQITLEEIQRGLESPVYRLQLNQQPKNRRSSGPRYTPLNKRQDKPDAVAWLLAHHPELKDAQIMRLVGTTKSTIDKIKSRQHSDIKNIKPRNPVELGMCSMADLEAVLNPPEKKHVVKKSTTPKATQEKSTVRPAPKKAAAKKPERKSKTTKTAKPSQKKNVTKKDSDKKPARKKKG